MIPEKSHSNNALLFTTVEDEDLHESLHSRFTHHVLLRAEPSRGVCIQWHVIEVLTDTDQCETLHSYCRYSDFHIVQAYKIHVNFYESTERDQARPKNVLHLLSSFTSYFKSCTRSSFPQLQPALISRWFRLKCIAAEALLLFLLLSQYLRCSFGPVSDSL